MFADAITEFLGRLLPKGYCLVLGILLLGCAAAIDFLIRARMREIGERSVFVSGGTFDYCKYLKVRKQFDWSPWPVYLIAPVLVLGIIFVVMSLDFSR